MQIVRCCPKVEHTLNLKIEILDSPCTFDEQFYKKITKGLHAGQNRGWAAVKSGCHFQRDMKVPAMTRMYQEGNADIYISLAVNERNRAERKFYAKDYNIMVITFR